MTWRRPPGLHRLLGGHLVYMDYDCIDYLAETFRARPATLTDMRLLRAWEPSNTSSTLLFSGSLWTAKGPAGDGRPA